jgi:phycocyanobilin lyase beta subunit
MTAADNAINDAPQKLIQAVEQADSPERMVAAVRSLAAARVEEGIHTLIAVLGYNNPAAAVAAVEGLIQLGGAAVQPLMELDEYNYGARAYAVRALAAIADPRALDVLVTSALNDFAPSVRRAAAKGLGNLLWNHLDAEQRQVAQAKALETLLSVSQDPDWSIRYAAVVGLQALSTAADLTRQIQAQFEQMAQTDADLAVRARVQLGSDLQIKTGE